MAIISKMQSKRFLEQFRDIAKSARNHSTAGACPVVGQSPKNLNAVRSFEEIPGPKGLPIVGNLFRFLPHIGIVGLKHSFLKSLDHDDKIVPC